MALRPVVVQFRFKNLKHVPSQMRQMSQETSADYIERIASQGSGVELIHPMQDRKVDLGGIRQALEADGLILAFGSHQKRVWRKDISQTIEMVRFHFLPKEVAYTHPEYDHEVVATGLDQITSMAFWHIVAYCNPGERGEWISLNATVRVQRYLGDNPQTPVLSRLKDETGMPYGNPVPVQADTKLEVIGGVPVLC